MNWAEEHLTAWQHLDFSIQTGKSAFEKLYGASFFEYLNQYPEKLHTYHKAMYEYAREDYKNLPEIIDFSEYTSVMDVGGGYGAVLEHVQNKNPQIHCILLDLPKVVEKIKNNAFEVIGANFFESIPKVTEAIILSRILHDWNDEKAKIILTNCYEALLKNGTLFVIENCIDKVTTDLSLLSLNMTVMCESFERTSTEYIYLAQNAGFEFKQDKKLNDLQTILIFQKI
jgi:SAM-dependent methyltransferase